MENRIKALLSSAFEKDEPKVNPNSDRSNEAELDEYHLSPKVREALKKLDTTEIVAKEVDFSKSLKKFANINILNIAKILYLEEELSFNELKIKTGLSVNSLNHTLQEMRNADLVILKEKKYAITNYGAIILTGILYIKQNLKYIGNFP